MTFSMNSQTWLNEKDVLGVAGIHPLALINTGVKHQTMVAITGIVYSRLQNKVNVFDCSMP